ncbi:MAG: UDP-2,3-diacylglucosamine diphosphatase, partial [Candidatus Zixiibacteriota bacterium]
PGKKKNNAYLKLVQKGIKIDYISGNHDFWMDGFFETQMRIKIHKDFLNIDYDNLRLHLIHGDGLASSDKGYRLLKKIFRNRFNIWLYRKLPPDWAIPLAKAVSSSSRKHSARQETTFASDYEVYAEKILNDGYDIVAIGHLHMPIYKDYNNGIYINTGDFIDHFSYARLADGKIRLEYIE